MLFFQQQWDDAAELIKKIIELAPEKDFGYALAEQLDTIKKNPELMKFSNEMKSQYYSL